MKRPWICMTLLLLPACSGSEADKTPDPVGLVAEATARSGTVDEAVTVYGAAEAGQDSERTLVAAAEATVAAILTPAGSGVTAGAPMVRLVPSPQSALDAVKARSDAAAASAAYARAQRLKADGLVGDTEVETARAAAEAANATSASLRSRAGQLAIAAPEAGVVDAMLVKPGDLVAAGTPVARIATGGAMRVRFGIDPVLAQAIAPGSRIAVAPVDGGAARIATVAGIDRVVDPTTRLAAVFANVPASAGLLLGQPLRGVISRPGGARGTVIPYVAVQDDGGVPFVYVVKDGVAHRREVRLGAQGAQDVIVAAGLAPGEVVVTQGGTALDDGMKVRTGAMPADTAKDAG